MNQIIDDTTHSAEAAALGFYYQAFFALETLVMQDADDASVAVERLDDVEVSANGHTLIYQLKHSISAKPPPVSIKSRALWKTIKVWVDLLPSLTLADTTLHLVAVGDIPSGSPLEALVDLSIEREDLVAALAEEAHRVVDAREEAKKLKSSLPFGERASGCEAFLSLSDGDRLNIFRRVLIQKKSPTIGEIEERIASHLKFLPAEQRPHVAKRLVEWWDRQVVYSLCGKRERTVSRTELQFQVMTIVGEIEDGGLVPEFETASHPEDYQPDGMLYRQISLVEGKNSDVSKAIREEWRARSQRSSWINKNPAMASTITDHDFVLRESWEDKHTSMVEDCSGFNDSEKCEAGLKILRWTHERAPYEVRPIQGNWNSPYYVRGSYQVLAIDLLVGWHPDYKLLLEGDE
jgi:hypothetical protein